MNTAVITADNVTDDCQTEPLPVELHSNLNQSSELFASRNDPHNGYKFQIIQHYAFRLVV